MSMSILLQLKNIGVKQLKCSKDHNFTIDSFNETIRQIIFFNNHLSYYTEQSTREYR